MRMKMALAALLGSVFLGTVATAADVTYFPHPNPAAANSEAVQVGDILYLSPVLGLAPGTATLAPGGVAGQTRAAMDKVGELLKARGLSYDDVFRCAVTVVDSVDPARMKAFNEVYVSYFKPGRYPARSLLSPANLPLKADLTVECWAHVPTK